MFIASNVTNLGQQAFTRAASFYWVSSKTVAWFMKEGRRTVYVGLHTYNEIMKTRIFAMGTYYSIETSVYLLKRFNTAIEELVSVVKQGILKDIV